MTPTGLGPACWAPFTSLYLDPHGDVLACCHSHITPLGNVTRSSLTDIWRGPEAAAMRDRLRRHDLGPECRFCAWQIDDGNVEQAYARNFDRFALAMPEVAWPRQIEFALSNRCNLQCVMCNGDFSSAIRSQREGRAPLPAVYGDEFFAELRPFLHHLEQARFLGGEPFLIPEYQRIWDAMIEDGLSVACDVTTNGTVWSGRLDATLEALPFSIAVSLDGATKATMESIRIGADFDDVMANVRRFSDYCHHRGTPFALTYCLMAANWRELPEFVALAEELGADVFVNSVTWPPHQALYALPAEDVAAVADQLETAAVHPSVRSEVARLRAWADRDPTATRVFVDTWSAIPPWLDTAPGSETVSIDEVADHLGRSEVDLLCTDGDRVVDLGGRKAFLGVDAATLVGRTYREALGAAADRLGPLVLVADERRYANGVERALVFGTGPTPTRVRAITVVDPDGRRATTAVAVVEAFPGVSRVDRSSGDRAGR